jgi:AcrR family transcriptional regulator
VGLRERKKEQVRQMIAETAQRLFEARGFEEVTVAEVAREAQVAEKTVFNYFPTKEDLFYHGMESYETELLAAMRDRAPGEAVLDAFRRFILEPRGMFAPQHTRNARNARAAHERLRQISRTIARSPALLAREEQLIQRSTASLAALIATETRGGAAPIEPWVVANALMGVHRALITYVRCRILADDVDLAHLGRYLRAEARRSLNLLEGGLGRYGPANRRTGMLLRRKDVR